MRKSLIPIILLAGACTPASLVPDTPSTAPDYFCTWNVQGYVCSYASEWEQRNAMTEEYMFGDGPLQGWTNFYPSVRKDLFFVMDDSWDIPANCNAETMNPSLGLLEPDPGRFPSYAAIESPRERLKALCSDVNAAGWKGLGGWVCAQQAEVAGDIAPEEYWKSRTMDAEYAGFRYWKVDWGKQDRDYTFRKMLTDLGAQYAPNLRIEHALEWPFLQFSDIYRTYDVENFNSQLETVRRIVELLECGSEEGSHTLLNCEDEPYIAAGLGCSIGVMRHPFVGPMPDGRADFVFPEHVRDLKHRLDEVTRAVRWHRIAAPFAMGGDFCADTLALLDEWEYRNGDSWMEREEGTIVSTPCAARVSRGMPLPEVGSEDWRRPLVLASTYPNGAVAVASIGRSIGREYIAQEVPVSIKVPSKGAKVGVFGVYESLTLEYPDGTRIRRVLAQDLAGDTPVDIGPDVKIDGNRVTIPGEVISRVGLMAATPGDVSEPGLVIVAK